MELGGLGGQMASDAQVKPLLNLGGEMDQFYCHGGIPLSPAGPPTGAG
jgi:hypothetical protein